MYMHTHTESSFSVFPNLSAAFLSVSLLKSSLWGNYESSCFCFLSDNKWGDKIDWCNTCVEGAWKNTERYFIHTKNYTQWERYIFVLSMEFIVWEKDGAGMSPTLLWSSYQEQRLSTSGPTGTFWVWAQYNGQEVAARMA